MCKLHTFQSSLRKVDVAGEVGCSNRQADVGLASTHISPSSESLAEAHSSPMLGRMKSWVLWPGPGAIQELGSRSPGLDWRVTRGLADTVLPPKPATDGIAAQTPPGPGGNRARATRWPGEPAALQPPLEGVGAGVGVAVWAEGWGGGWGWS